MKRLLISLISIVCFFYANNVFSQNHNVIFSNSISENFILFLDNGYSYKTTKLIESPNLGTMSMYSYKWSEEGSPLNFIEYSVTYDSKGKVYEVDILTAEEKLYMYFINQCKNGKKIKDDTHNELCFYEGFYFNIQTINKEGFLFYLIRIER